MDQWDGIIIGAAVAAIATVVVTNLLDKTPLGGGTPNQTATPSANARAGVLYVEVPAGTSPYAAPVAQNTPITEAAYNQEFYAAYEPAFGINANRPGGQEGPEPILVS